MYNSKPVGSARGVGLPHADLLAARCARPAQDRAREGGCDKTGVEGPDGKFLVKDMECLGLCEVAPAVFVDGEPHVNVTPDQLAKLMDECE